MPDYSGVGQLPPGHRFSYWLGKAAREVREEADGTLPSIASKLGRRGIAGLERFERGQTLPQRLEQVLAAYALEAELEDPREIIVRAMRDWFQGGGPPVLNGGDPS